MQKLTFIGTVRTQVAVLMTHQAQWAVRTNGKKEREKERGCVCACVCVCERERERKREVVCVRVCERERVRKRERESVCQGKMCNQLNLMMMMMISS